MYIGTKPQSGFITTAKQRVTSSTNNYVDLDHSISSLADVIVWVNFVKQDSTNLTLTTSSRITLGATLVASDIVEIAYLGKAVATQTPSSGTVTNDMLAGSIANSKLANSSITLNGSAVSLGGSATTPSGGLVFLGGSDTGSNTSQISVDNVFSATYKNYLVIVSKNTPATNKKLFFKFRDDTPADVTNNYMYNYTGILANNGNTTQRAEINQAGVQMTDEEVSNSSNKLGLKKTMWVQNPFSNSTFTNFHGTFNYVDGSTNNIGGYFGGTHESNASIRGVTFYASSGSVNVTVKVYGVVDS